MCVSVTCDLRLDALRQLLGAPMDPFLPSVSVTPVFALPFWTYKAWLQFHLRPACRNNRRRIWPKP